MFAKLRNHKIFLVSKSVKLKLQATIFFLKKGRTKHSDNMELYALPYHYVCMYVIIYHDR